MNIRKALSHPHRSSERSGHLRVGLALAALLVSLLVVAACESTQESDMSGAALRQAGSGPPMPDSIGGLVWLDADEDSETDLDEPGVGSVAIRLWRDVNGDGACNTSTEEMVATTVTDELGHYSFNNVTGADYCVEIVAEGMTLTGGAQSMTDAITAGGEPVTDIDFGVQ